jgi:hypothetical protein
MNYKLVDSEEMLHEGEYMFRVWDLVEIPTGLTIKSSLKKDEAKSMLRHMNMGGAFDGFTPSFFCKDIKEILC